MQKKVRTILRKRYYPNGQLAIFLRTDAGEALAELSISCDEIYLEEGEFVLKDVPENAHAIELLIEEGEFCLTDKFVLIGSRIYPVCRILS
ncbi:MAG: hypothetical protein JW891_13845 [Candidatus Lokiarchaeota archaeon]|nr:hypothetical protein [Candidatus Lokiarchaeota archaeon]